MRCNTAGPEKRGRRYYKRMPLRASWQGGLPPPLHPPAQGVPPVDPAIGRLPFSLWTPIDRGAPPDPRQGVFNPWTPTGVSAPASTGGRLRLSPRDPIDAAGGCPPVHPDRRCSAAGSPTMGVSAPRGPDDPGPRAGPGDPRLWPSAVVRCRVENLRKSTGP